MVDTHIVTARDLSQYADTRDSQGVIPELINRLIHQIAFDLIDCRIPHGDAINQPGLDGLVNCKLGFPPFIPAGISYWEIGVSNDPQSKATKELEKRTDGLNPSERATASFIFVTPRSSGVKGWNEPKQSEWIKKHKDKGWKELRVIDGVKLADWLREYPSLGQWMALKLGINPKLGDLITPLSHWDLIKSTKDKNDPFLPPNLFTVSRESACAALEDVFSGDSNRLFLFAESEDDVDDFVAAYLASLEEATAQKYIDRCLFIKNEDTWRTISDLRSSYVLVANARLGLDSSKKDLQAVATNSSHRVIIPLCGALSGDSPEIIKLRSPSKFQIEKVLKAAMFSDLRARELAGIGDGSLSALRRHLLGLSAVPPYASWETAHEIARAGLAGQWNANNPADVRALEKLLGKDYGEWIETLRADTLRSDSPLIQTDEKWRFITRGETWSALGNRITDEDLDRFKDFAIFVLGERDPMFDLPKDDQYAANLYGKQLEYSHNLREGIAETLALMGSRPQALSLCSHGKAVTTALLVIRELLSQASWERWASLNSLLPLLAEAAPDEFLDAVEFALVDLQNSPFHKVFSQEGNGVVGGSNHITGLLWALEGLAWHPAYLSRVAVILADLASIDPGGTWSNRPANSLIDIFLPWHIQSTAPFDKRKAAIESVLKEQPTVGWTLLLALLPNNHQVTTGCHHPVWRDFIPRDWKDGVLVSEYWEQITTLAELAVALAKEDSAKLAELVSRLTDLPVPAHDSILNHLSSNDIVSLPETERLAIWEKLNELVRRHRKFHDADWALPEEQITKIEKVTKLLAPSLPELKYQFLFADRSYDLLEERGNYDEQRKQLDEKRLAAVSEILGEDNLAKCLDFAKMVTSPQIVGNALGTIASPIVEATILPTLLCSTDETEIRVAGGFVWTRYWTLGIDWVDSVLKKDWSPEQHAKFLTFLPPNEEVWTRVSSFLGETNEALYWKNIQINPYDRDRDFTIAIEKLLTYDRAGIAVMCIACNIDDESNINETLAVRSLLAVLSSEDGAKDLDNYHTVELIKRLQLSKTVDQDALYQIEWSFLPWLDRFSSGSPITLEKRLASDPAFFAEVVKLVFRSEKDSDDTHKEINEQTQRLARNSYKLLAEWKHCPGIQEDGTFDIKAFNSWFKEARRITEETGHGEVALSQIGHMLTHAPADPNGLWIHEAVATELNRRDTQPMRSGFTTELFNSRGVHYYTHGQEERKLAKNYGEKADALDSKNFTRFATAMREFAEQYIREAESEEKRNLFE